MPATPVISTVPSPSRRQPNFCAISPSFISMLPSRSSRGFVFVASWLARRCAFIFKKQKLRHPERSEGPLLLFCALNTHLQNSRLIPPLHGAKLRAALKRQLNRANHIERLLWLHGQLRLAEHGVAHIRVELAIIPRLGFDFPPARHRISRKIKRSPVRFRILAPARAARCDSAPQWLLLRIKSRLQKRSRRSMNHESRRVRASHHR